MAAQVVVAGNPAASRARGGAAAAQAAERLRAAGHEVEVVDSADGSGLEHALRSRVQARRPDAVVIVGGDGTVHAAVNALAGSGVPLGLVPAGAGNDVARSLGLPHDDVAAALEAIVVALGDPVTALGRRVDAVHTSTGRWFAGVLSTGFDSNVNQRANRMRHPRGRARYVLAVLLELVRLTPHRYRMTIDRDPRHVDAVLLTVGNTASFGGGMRILPDARADDGLLDVLVAAPMSRRSLLRLLPRVFEGTHVHDSRVGVERGRVVTIAVTDGRTPEPIVYADGERFGSLPLTLEVVPGALRVLGPDHGR
jgi:diacylglycerol kinase (ATP)